MFFYGMKMELEKPNISIGKIKAAVEKNNKDNFAVIARTESLVQGHGHDVALERAKMYTDAGCDGFLIHSKSKTPDEVLKFADMYHSAGLKTPLVCVPTTYNQVTKQQLEDSGFSMAIYMQITQLGLLLVYLKKCFLQLLAEALFLLEMSTQSQ